MVITLKRTDLNKKYHINKNAWDRRHDDLMDYLRQYMDITEEKSESGRFSYVIKGPMPDEIPEFPRKSRKAEKEEAYKSYILKNELTDTFAPNSKAKVARDASRDFAKADYGHTYIPAIVRRFSGPIMDEYGERTKERVWVDLKTYKELPQEEVEDLRHMFIEAKLSKEEMACAWVKEQQGEDTSEEQSSYQTVMAAFAAKYGHRAVLVCKWRRKQLKTDK